MAETGRKQFTIPNQIDGSFHIWRFVTLREFLLLLPSIGIGFLLYRYVLAGWELQMRAFFSFLPAVFCIAAIFIRPMPDRKNVNLFQLAKWRIRFNQRQRQFFFKRNG